MLYLLVALEAYFLGSIPAGPIAGWINGVDLSKQGSGNTGATNALRILGKKWGYFVLGVDILKGWLAVIVAFSIAKISFHATPPETINAGVLAAIFSVIGHSYPVWLGFRGGKGISTSAGVMLALFPWQVFASGLVVWLVLFYSTRYVSIASLGAALALPIASTVMWQFGECDPVRITIAATMCALAVWRHKSNIVRLLAGTETRFEKKRPPVS